MKIAARDFSNDSHFVEGIQRVVERLRTLEEIAFVEAIQADYQVGQINIAISAKYAWTGNSIHLTWVRGRPMLESMLASLISQECIPAATARAQLSDGVFRLVNCKNGGDIQEYLEQRGIPWRPKASDNDEEAMDYINDDVEEAILAAVRVRPQGVPTASRANLPSHRTDQYGPVVKPGRAMEMPLTLPPIEKVRPSVVKPNSDWSYTPGTRGGNRHGGGGWSPRSRNEEKDEMIGRRGEEIVYRLEPLAKLLRRPDLGVELG